MRTIRKLLRLGLNPSSTILVYASSFQNDNQTSSYCNAFFLRPGNMQGSQNVHSCVHMYTFMYICQLIIKGAGRNPSSTHTNKEKKNDSKKSMNKKYKKDNKHTKDERDIYMTDRNKKEKTFTQISPF